MKNLATILALILGLGLVVMGCVGDSDDDDSSNDDDDDSTPTYTGTIDMNNATLYASCAATVGVVEDGPPGEGSFDFEIDLEGWAAEMWVEMWDQTSPYCEGWDPDTGDVCETDGYDRPGWDMINVDYGWNDVDGFWDNWGLHLEYYQELAVAHAAGKSIFICENAGNNFQTHFCGCDYATQECICTEFPMDAW